MLAVEPGYQGSVTWTLDLDKAGVPPGTAPAEVGKLGVESEYIKFAHR